MTQKPPPVSSKEISAESHCHSFNIHGWTGREGTADQKKHDLYKVKHTENFWNLANLKLSHEMRKCEHISNTCRDVWAIDSCDGCLRQLSLVEETFSSSEYLNYPLNLSQMRYSACLCLI